MADQKSLYEKLTELAHNLWWSWQPEVVSIFRDIDPKRWLEIDHNPVQLLSEYTPETLEKRAHEAVLHTRITWAYRRWQEYMQSETTWAGTNAGVLGRRPVAYFSAEFGLHESLPVYSGGLGVLAGDHLKSASDLGVPLVGMGLFYSQGYFSQWLDETGWQQAIYPNQETGKLPMDLARGPDGKPVRISVDTRGGKIFARVLRVDVGRVPLFLLDTNIPENTEEDRHLTARLYGGDTRTRIRQELILGIGGARALSALGIVPGVVHMNEGHSAFAGLEMIRQRMKEDAASFDEALRETSRSSCFTTHTPVAAGHDRFAADLVEEHLGPVRDELHLSHDGLMALGRVDTQNHGEAFCMTVLAFKLSRHANGVSNLHGVVSRRMWANLWPWKSEEEIPIGHITNGIHVGTWLAPQMRMLYDRVLPLNWHERTAHASTWEGVDDVTPGELWETHQSLKSRLIAYVRERLHRQAQRHESPERSAQIASLALDPRKLLIGFARRFAPYKRADLIMKDLDGFADLVEGGTPVQMVIAGKSHPADDPGKQLLQRIWKVTQQEPFKGRVIFLEDYDIGLTRHLIQGVDVWLNNPRRPLEASGTSGEKVVLNGALNCSILDGWWAEAYDGTNGFAIGNGRTHSDVAVQDERDGRDLIRVLREEVLPMYYERDADDLPQRWIKSMKRGVKTLGWRFNADRMVMDYVMSAYVPAAGGTSCDMSMR
jgi:glycogen phosphorylase